MVVIYAEKPSVAETIASALSGGHLNKADKKNGYYKIMYRGIEHAVTWGYGHLCTLAEASQYNAEYKNWRKLPLPFIPEQFKVVLNTGSKQPVKEAYSVVKKLFQEADWIINATDFDREGELIFYYLYSYMGCKKPVMRAKLVRTTEDGVQEAFSSLMKSTDFAGLLASARCRSIADWVVGCNLTAALTLARGGQSIYSIGRVQTPTLAMVVARDQEIAAFKPEDYYTVEGVFTKDNGEYYKGTHQTKAFKEKAEAEQVLSRCQGQNGTVTDVTFSEESVPVPKLYNLDALQMEANTRYGMSLKRTLDVTQSLYEKGYVTYPRSDCMYLPEDMTGPIRKIQQMLRGSRFHILFNGDASDSNMISAKKTWFDDSKLGSHYAIIPTERLGENLSEDEEKVYGLVVDSVIRMLYPPARIGHTKIVTEVAGEQFLTTGKSILEKGWMFVNGEKKEELLPDVSTGERVEAECSLQSKKTRPPKHFTDKTLLAAMITAGKNLEDADLRKFMEENKIPGIGTVATRAQIIETLLARGMLVRDKKNILATERGIHLIQTFPVEDVKSAEMTARYEQKLDLIVKGQESPDAFLHEIYADVRKWCAQVGTLPKEEQPADSNHTDLMCPVCGASLIHYKWGFGCSEHANGCNFAIGIIAGVKLTENQVRTFLSKEKIGPLTFKKKDGTPFKAYLCLVKDGDGYKVAFDSGKPRVDTAQVQDVYSPCPVCGKKVVKGKFGWECSGKCGMEIPYQICSVQVPPDLAELLLAGKQTPVLDGFVSKKGSKFKAALFLEKGKVKFVFDDEKPDLTGIQDVYTACPSCGKKIVKGRFGWECSGKCGTEIPYQICSVPITPDLAELLLAGKQTPVLEGFVSKKGSKFKAAMVLEKGKVKFLFDEEKPDLSGIQDVYATCPSCGKKIVKGRFGWECSGKCGVGIPYELCGVKITAATAEVLFGGAKTPMMEGFVSRKTGKTFSAGLVIEDKKLSFFFPEH